MGDGIFEISTDDFYFLIVDDYLVSVKRCLKPRIVFYSAKRTTLVPLLALTREL
jgi:hypothetical protein